VLAQHGEAAGQAGPDDYVWLDDVERWVLEEHGGDQRMAVLGECSGDDGAERVTDDD
jgi:hypothetical protein